MLKSSSVKYWLMKSEPSCYSIDDLKTDKITMWDGVRNYQVRNMMRDEISVGDKALFYHSSVGNETGVVGEMVVAKSSYPDPTQFDATSDHPDPRSDPNNPRWVCIDMKFVNKFKKPLFLSLLKKDKLLSLMKVAKKGSRLSITSVTKEEFKRIIELTS